MTRHALVVGLLLGGALVPAPVRAGEGIAAGTAPPSDNSSYVPDDHESVRRDWTAALDAISSKQFTDAVRALQRVAEGPHDAVIAAGEPGVLEGAEVAAHHRVLVAGAACLEAYEREFGAAATTALDRAVQSRDERRIAEVVTTFRPAAAGRAAALFLADLAIERADADLAFGFIEGLEDLEQVAASDLAEPVAAWKTARVTRLATLLGKDAQAAKRIATALRERPERPIDRNDRWREPDSSDWATSGGNAARSAVVPALGERLRYASSEWLGIGTPIEPPWGSDENPARSPSLWIPTRAVVANGHIFVSDGQAIRVFESATGKFRHAFPLHSGDRADAPPPGAGRPSRERFGWIEGHGLTIDGDRIYVTQAADLEQVEFERASLARKRDLEEERRRDGQPFERPRPAGPLTPPAGLVERPPPPAPEALPAGSAALEIRESVPRDRVVALRWTGHRIERLWDAGGGIAMPRFPAGMRLCGTPLVYRGRIHVAGLRPTLASPDRIEAWHVALDPATGRVESSTLLGVGGPVRLGRGDEAVPSSCAAAHGRVVVVTSLGIAAAVDARTGRTLWSYRYDRGRPDGDDLGHRLDGTVETAARKSSFVNEPPLLVDGRCFFAPTDSRYIFAIADRPRGQARTSRLWRRHRVDDFRNLAVEQLVGVIGEADAEVPVLVVAGQGYEGEGSPHTAVVALDPATGLLRWERALPFASRPEPFGRALVTTEEVYVSTQFGIARYRVRDGAELSILDGAAVAKEGGSLEDAYGRAYEPIGNLIPIPGKGIVTVNPSSMSIWRKP